MLLGKFDRTLIFNLAKVQGIIPICYILFLMFFIKLLTGRSNGFRVNIASGSNDYDNDLSGLFVSVKFM